MRGLILAVALLASSAAYAAGYPKPAGVPEVFMPDHGVTVGVWAAQTPIGNGIGVFELQNGSWNLCGQCLVTAETPSTFDSIVAASGGPQGYVKANLASINTVLSIRYPSVGGGSGGTVLDQVNQSLGSYQLRLSGGVPAIGPR